MLRVYVLKKKKKTPNFAQKKKVDSTRVKRNSAWPCVKTFMRVWKRAFRALFKAACLRTPALGLAMLQ